MARRPTTAASGIAGIVVDVDADSVQLMIARLIRQLNPVMLGAWMHLIVGPYLRTRADNRFASEGDDVVGQWLPLAEATVHFRESQGFPGSHPINVRTGELEQYITGGDAFVTASELGATLTWPANLPGSWILEKKVKTAQSGDERTPARPVIGLNERDLMFVLAALSIYLMDPAGEGVKTVTGGEE